MAIFGHLPGILSLLLLLHWKLGAGNPLYNIADNVNCTTNYLCSSNVTAQIKKQVEHLNSSADALLVAYSTAQGEPFSSLLEKMCGQNLTDFSPSHTDNPVTDKLVELYRFMVYFSLSLDEVRNVQLLLNPQNEDLHHQIKSTGDTVHGMLSNMVCYLCTQYTTTSLITSGGQGSINGLTMSNQGVFQQKQLGCQLLMKYKQVITEAAQAF